MQKAIRVLVEAMREPAKVPLYKGFETVAEAWQCLQGPLTVNVVGAPKEAMRVQHSHSLYNTLTTVRKFYYKPRECL